jgi:hypothetical protein
VRAARGASGAEDVQAVRRVEAGGTFDCAITWKIWRSEGVKHRSIIVGLPEGLCTEAPKGLTAKHMDYGSREYGF